jgi:hypothetical protein
MSYFEIRLNSPAILLSDLCFQANYAAPSRQLPAKGKQL